VQPTGSVINLPRRGELWWWEPPEIGRRTGALRPVERGRGKTDVMTASRVVAGVSVDDRDGSR
jgi:hypothetical protein